MRCTPEHKMGWVIGMRMFFFPESGLAEVKRSLSEETHKNNLLGLPENTFDDRKWRLQQPSLRDWGVTIVGVRVITVDRSRTARAQHNPLLVLLYCSSPALPVDG